MTRRRVLLAGAVTAASLISCGYHVGGKADLVPKSVQTIAIAPFSTLSMRYRLVDLFPQEIAREFRSRTRFSVIDNPAEADAVLHGSINSTSIGPQIYDPGSGKATTVQITVNLTINLVDQKTGKPLYSRANWPMRNTYEIATDPHQFFNESSPAFDRLSRDLARELVSAIVENF